MKNENHNFDVSKLKISDIIDLEFLQRFQDDFAEAVGVASISIDLNGNPITEASNFRRFCMDLTRTSKEGLARCKKCDAEGGEKAMQTGKPSIYACHAGLVDFAAPIMLEGKQIGSIIGGQVLTEAPDEAHFRRIAKEIGVDPDDYWDAVKMIEPISKRRIEKAADLLSIVAKNISEIGFNKHRIDQVVESLANHIDQIASTMEELTAASIEVAENQSTLSNEIQEVNRLSEEINTIMGFIRNIADETNLLGLNAAIEAARAHEAGKGFAVVAQRIRQLSSDSKEKVLTINKFTSDIQQSVERTVSMSQGTLTTTEEQTAALQEITSNIQELTDEVQKLRDLTKKE